MLVLPAELLLLVELEEEIYLKYPDGYFPGEPGKVCKLKKAIYGLKQAPRAWYSKLRSVLEGMGFNSSVADPGLFILNKGSINTYLLLHVDDMLVMGPDSQQIQRVKQLLGQHFEVKDLGEACFYLGLEITRDRANRALVLSQKKKTQELVSKFIPELAKPAVVPMSSSIQLTKEPKEGSEYMDLETSRYAELVGGLLYLSTKTMPDTSYPVRALARYMAKPTSDHSRAALTIVRYLAGTVQYGIRYSGSQPAEVVGYSDANHACDLDTRRSTTGYTFVLHGGSISWNSRLQPTVAVSTAEAEYMAAAASIKEALWLKKLLPELGIPAACVHIRMDNQGALKILQHPNATQRSKHIDIQHHFAKERVMRGDVSVEYISTNVMVADSLTKAMGLVSC